MRKKADGPPVRKSNEVAPGQRVPLRSLSSLTWSEFVVGVQNDTVELPKPWSYPRERLALQQYKPKATDVIGVVVGPPNRYSGGRDTYWVEYPGHWLQVLTYGPYPPDSPPYITERCDSLVVIDADVDFPTHEMHGHASAAAPLLVLHHPEVTLMPAHRGDEAYVLGPFDVAIVAGGGWPRWEAMRTGDCKTAGGHPNLFPAPCYGGGDWETLLERATREQEWGELLFIIHRFLGSWNPDDTPLGHPSEIATSRVPWTGEVLADVVDDERWECYACGCRLYEGEIYASDDSDSVFCKHCYYENFTDCDECGSSVERSYINEVFNRQLCSACRDKLIFYCRVCDEPATYADNVAWKNTRRVYACCDGCIERLYN